MRTSCLMRSNKAVGDWSGRFMPSQTLAPPWSPALQTLVPQPTPFFPPHQTHTHWRENDGAVRRAVRVVEVHPANAGLRRSRGRSRGCEIISFQGGR